jgi:hemerythrin
LHWIPWSDILTIGCAEIDAEHKTLVAMFNELANAERNKKGKRVCVNALDAIIEFAISHFKHEAELMAEHHFPDAAQHNLEHVQLIKLARNFRTKFDSGLPGTHIQIVHFPEDWLTRHVLTSDRAFGEFLARTNSAGQSR